MIGNRDRRWGGRARPYHYRAALAVVQQQWWFSADGEPQHSISLYITTCYGLALELPVTMAEVLYEKDAVIASAALMLLPLTVAARGRVSVLSVPGSRLWVVWVRLRPVFTARMRTEPTTACPTPAR